MDPGTANAITSVADRLTAFALVVIALVSGSRGVWVFASVVKERDARITKLEAKLEQQERLIDRLSGVGERSTEIAGAAVIHEIREHRRQSRGASG
jgi:hypothetical protein